MGVGDSPGKPVAVDQTSSTVRIRWDALKCDTDIEHFEVKYQRDGEKKWKSIETDGNIQELSIGGLKSNAKYRFKVRTVFEDGEESTFSDTSADIETMGSLAEKVKQTSTKIESDECACLYKVPIVGEEKQSTDLRVRKCTVLTGKCSILSFIEML